MVSKGMDAIAPIRCDGGFTLIEMLVVVIILAVLAGILITAVSDSAVDSQEAALISTLTGMRKAIDVYKQEHGTYPGQTTAKPTKGACSGTEGKGKGWPDNKGAKKAFVEQLTSYTTSAGGACSIGGDPFRYGPYLRADGLPLNPLTGKNDLKLVDDGDLTMSSDAKSPKGWKYDVLTGKLIADDRDHDHL